MARFAGGAGNPEFAIRPLRRRRSKQETADAKAHTNSPIQFSQQPRHSLDSNRNFHFGFPNSADCTPTSLESSLRVGFSRADPFPTARHERLLGQKAPILRIQFLSHFHAQLSVSPAFGLTCFARSILLTGCHRDYRASRKNENGSL